MLVSCASWLRHPQQTAAQALASLLLFDMNVHSALDETDQPAGDGRSCQVGNKLH